jgi:hypothetical protein
MTIDTFQERESDQLPIASPGEAPPSTFLSEEVDIIALRLWQRGCCLETIGDDCSLCKGEAQQCLGICQ